MGIKMDGKALADKIAVDLKQRCENLKSKSLIPSVDIYTANDDSIANMYLRSKLNRCQEIGIETVVKNCNEYDTLGIIRSISNSNNPVIIEEPIPSAIDKELLCGILISWRDLDGWSMWNKAKLYSNEQTDIITGITNFDDMQTLSNNKCISYNIHRKCRNSFDVRCD